MTFKKSLISLSLLCYLFGFVCGVYLLQTDRKMWKNGKSYRFRALSHVILTLRDTVPTFYNKCCGIYITMPK